MTLDPKIKAVGFDMDGTLMDTRVDYHKLAQVVIDTYSKYGVPADVFRKGDYKLTITACDRWLTDNKLWDYKHDVDVEFQKNVSKIEMENSNEAKIFAGATELIGKLKSKGYKVGILTRGGRRYAEYILGRAGVLNLFDAVVARDDHPEIEAKPARISMEHLATKLGVRCDEILYLGDGLVDYLTCVNSGAQFIGVCSGHDNRSREVWASKVGEEVKILPSVAELIPLV